MSHRSQALCREAVEVWQAGVAAVRGDRLIQQRVRLDHGLLTITGMDDSPWELDLDGVRRVCIVGAGKAAASLAVALERKLSVKLDSDQLFGWVNVPDDAVLPSPQLTIHPSRPSGMNEPTAAAVAGAESILRLVRSLTTEDLCFVVLTGGGSALLPAPIDGVSWQDKVEVARWLAAAGADIRQLNTIRKRLSRIKGGGLARVCPAPLVALIVSDVLGDPLDVIASGPTVADTSAPDEALAIMNKYDPERNLAPRSVWKVVEQSTAGRPQSLMNTTNIVLANNQTAVQQAASEASQRGYAVEVIPTDIQEPGAEQVGRRLAEQACELQHKRSKRAIIGGGEPVVRLAPRELRGKGGRNQQLVLAALDYLVQQADGTFADSVLLSAGTDGEDGPTDAAGAVIGADHVRRLCKTNTWNVSEHLQRNDAYPLLDQLGALIRTGPTQTNVCDVRVVLHDPTSRAGA